MGDWGGWEGQEQGWDNGNSWGGGGGGGWKDQGEWNEDQGGWKEGGDNAWEEGEKKWTKTKDWHDRKEWKGRQTGKNMYSKTMREDHGEQMEMWRSMKASLETATEETLLGLTEAAHEAIADHFASTDGRLLNNGEVSRTVEYVLEFSAPTQLRGFFFKLRGWMCFLMVQKTASRVLETLFKQCYRHLAATDAVSKSADEEDDTRLPTLQALLRGAVEEIIDGDTERNIKLIDLLQDASSSFALRVLLQVAAGQRPPEKAKNGSLKDSPETMPALDEGRLIANLGAAVVKVLTEQSIFAQLCKTSPVVGLLEVLIQTWPDAGALHEHVAEHVEALLRGSISSRLVEASLKSKEGHERLHPYILENWEAVASTSIHAAGKWIASCPTAESYLAAIEAVLQGAAVVKQRHYYAIVVGAAEGARPYVPAQSKVLSLMTAVFGDLKTLPATLLNMQGSRSGPVILSHLLAFGPAKVGVLYRGTLDLPQWQLVQMASGHDGSVVLENLIKYGAQKEAKKLCTSLEGSYLSVVLTAPAGAMTVEKLFGAATLMGRRKIAEELGAGIQQLNAVFHARKTVKKLRLDQFTHRVADWDEQEKKLVKKNKLLASIFNSSAAVEGTAALLAPSDDETAPEKKAKKGKKEKKAAADPAEPKKAKKEAKAEKPTKRARATLSDSEDDEGAPPPAKKAKKEKKVKK